MTFKPAKGLDAAELKRVLKYRVVFERIEDITGVPWRAVAAIWTRESFSVAIPTTPGGCYQFDPMPSRGTLRGLLDRFTKLSSSDKTNIISNADAFFQGGVLAACFLRVKVGPVIDKNASDDLIKDALWGYNGRVQKSVDLSAYVMNGYDAAHYPLRLKGSIPLPDGKRQKVDFQDKRPGAFTVYMQLKG